MNSRKGKNISLTLVCAALILCMSACGKKAADNPNTNSYSVLEDLDSGTVNLNTSIEDFLADGYELGDSLDISFSNGQKLEDIPFYDGYYVRTNKPLIVAYPGYKYIAIGYSSGDSMWEMLEFSDSDTAQVSIRERGKYLNIQENLSAVYSDNRSDFGEDYVFANFRSLTGGNIRPLLSCVWMICLGILSALRTHRR